MIVLVACSAPVTPAHEPAPAPPPKRDLAVAEPPPKQPTPPEEIDPYGQSGRDRLITVSPRRRDLVPIGNERRVFPLQQEIDVAARDLWSPCVRDFVQAQPEHARRPFAAVVARYPTSCDASHRIVVEAPLEYRDRFVVLRGALTALTLDVVTCGMAPNGSVEIIYDGRRWTGLATTEQISGCAITSVPDMPSLRRVLRDVVDAKDVIARVDTIDVVVTFEMKRDLRLMLDALDVLSAR